MRGKRAIEEGVHPDPVSDGMGMVTSVLKAAVLRGAQEAETNTQGSLQ